MEGWKRKNSSCKIKGQKNTCKEEYKGKNRKVTHPQKNKSCSMNKNKIMQTENPLSFPQPRSPPHPQVREKALGTRLIPAPIIFSHGTSLICSLWMPSDFVYKEKFNHGTTKDLAHYGLRPSDILMEHQPLTFLFPVQDSTIAFSFRRYRDSS